MDYQRFCAQLPDFFENWGLESVIPQNQAFAEVLKQVRGMTTASILQVLNLAVECLEAGEVYCEIGCLQGASLIGALLNHPEAIAYAVDNFSEADPFEENLNLLSENLLRFGMDEQVLFCYQGFEDFFQDLAIAEDRSPIGLYFYDGAHDYRSHLLSLLKVRPFLAERALILVANGNSEAVQQATWDFVATNPQCKWLLHLSTSSFAHPTFWNGLQVLSWDVSQTQPYAPETLRQARQETFLQTVEMLAGQERQQLTQALKVEAMDAVFQSESVHLKEYGQYPEIVSWVRKPLLKAEAKFREVLLRNPLDLDAWYNLGTIYSELEQYDKALDTFAHSLSLNQAQPLVYCELGLIFEQQNDQQQAIQAYQRSLELDLTCIQAFESLGKLFTQSNDLAPAEAIYRQAIAANPDYFGGYLGLGNVLLNQGRLDEAIVAFEKTLSLREAHPEALEGLGRALAAQGKELQASLYLGDAALFQGNSAEAIKHYQRYLELQPDPTAIALEVYLNLANAYRAAGQETNAATVCQQALQQYPTEETLHVYQITSLQNSGCTEAAIQAAQTAAIQFADNPSWQFEQWRTFPILYTSEAEIDLYRDRFTHGVKNLIQNTSLETPKHCWQAMLGIWWRTNFYLQYQCRDDRELQTLYGEYVSRVMAANYPQWAERVNRTPPIGRKIRIGFASAHLRNHNGAKWALGWIKPLNRQEFEVYCYHTGQIADQISRQFELHSDRFYHFPNALEAVCQQIQADQLDILIYTDIGMDPMTTQMVGLRLAPVQCTAWGHPVTSGLPTIDYYLSSDLMEPENAQEHYSETLMRLPNTGLCYSRPDVPPLPHTRQDFGLREDAIVYLSPQSLFKYLPQHDDVFAEIAMRVPQAQFAFLAFNNPTIVEQFQARLRRAFAEKGLNSDDFCVIVPRQKQLGYWGLNTVSDVFIDNFGWGGGNTVFEAIACGLPVLTCPGEFMRGRHADAILKMMGMTEMIAKDKDEFVAIATQLGLDNQYRNQIKQQQWQRSDLIFHDTTCVKALEAFFHQVVQ